KRGPLCRVCRRQPYLRCQGLSVLRRADRAAHAPAVLYSPLHLHPDSSQRSHDRALLAHSPRRLFGTIALNKRLKRFQRINGLSKIQNRKCDRGFMAEVAQEKKNPVVVDDKIYTWPNHVRNDLHSSM